MIITKLYSHILTTSFLLLTLVVFNPVTASGQIKISGKVVNSSGQPMSYAAVELCKDSTVVQTVLTDVAGVYQMEVQAGWYSQNCRYAGSVQRGPGMNIIRDTTVHIEFTKQIALEEVIVRSGKPLIERKIDRHIFNVENSVLATGSDVLEAMYKTPCVRIQNNQISLTGKNSVAIVLDDRLVQLSGEDLCNFLKSVPSNQIQKIEVITNFPAYYDAQGNSGIINIVLKKNLADGYSGSVNLGYTQTTYPLYTGGGGLTYNSTKVAFFADGGLTNGYTRTIQRNLMFYPEQTWEQTTTQKLNNQSFNGRAGIDFKLSKKTKLGLTYATSIGNPTSPDNIPTTIYNKNQEIDSTLTTRSVNNRNKMFHDFNLHAEILLDSLNKKVTLNGCWFNFKDLQNRDFVNERFYSNGEFIPGSFTHNIAANNQMTNLYMLNADASLPFKKFTLSAGGKLGMAYNHSDVSLFRLQQGEQKIDVDNSNEFRYQEIIQALYANVYKKIKTWELQIGVRGEKTQARGESITTGQIQTYNYYRVFPTLFIRYNVGEKNTYAINYSRRINRPAYKYLNPFRGYLNPYTYTEGNPFLQPSYSHNIEVSHTYDGKLSTALSYSHETDGFSQITLVENDHHFQVTKPLNFFTYQSYQMINTLSFSPARWLETNIQSQLTFGISHTDLPQVTWPKLQAWSEYVSIDNQMIFNKAKTIRGSFSIGYQTPTVNAPFKIRSVWNMDAGFKVLLLKKRLQLSLTGSDIFASSINRMYSNVNNILQYYHNYYDSRRVKIAVVFCFGNNKFLQKDRTIGNEEEKSRVK